MVDPRHVVILGMMGVGKSTTGRALAHELSWSYSDSDDDIEALTGSSGRDLADELGVPELHRLEAAVLFGALCRPEPTVITAAASVIENDMVRRCLPNRAVVVRLVAPVETTLSRQAAGDHRRPMTAADLVELETRRKPLFESVEDMLLDALCDTGELVREIIEHRQARELS